MVQQLTIALPPSNFDYYPRRFAILQNITQCPEKGKEFKREETRLNETIFLNTTQRKRGWNKWDTRHEEIETEKKSRRRRRRNVHLLWIIITIYSGNIIIVVVPHEMERNQVRSPLQSSLLSVFFSLEKNQKERRWDEIRGGKEDQMRWLEQRAERLAVYLRLLREVRSVTHEIAERFI